MRLLDSARLAALGATVALLAHGIMLWELTAVFGLDSDAGRLATQTIAAGAAPFLCLLLALAVAGALRWSRLIPWGLLVTPWLVVEGVTAIETASQPGLVGRMATAGLAAGVADVFAAAALVGGSARWWWRRRTRPRRPADPSARGG